MKHALEQASEYTTSRQGLVNIAATALTVFGLVTGKNRLAAIGVGIFGLVVFPLTVASSWRSRQHADQRLRDIEQEHAHLSHLVHERVGPVNVQVRQLERRFGRFEAQQDASPRRL